MTPEEQVLELIQAELVAASVVEDGQRQVRLFADQISQLMNGGRVGHGWPLVLVEYIYNDVEQGVQGQYIMNVNVRLHIADFTLKDKPGHLLPLKAQVHRAINGLSAEEVVEFSLVRQAHDVAGNVPVWELEYATRWVDNSAVQELELVPPPVEGEVVRA